MTNDPLKHTPACELDRDNRVLTRAIDVAGPRGETVPVEGIRLRKESEYTVVDAEIGGTWVEVIRERSDGQFCHIVEPSGMFSAYYAMPRNGARRALEPKP